MTDSLSKNIETFPEITGRQFHILHAIYITSQTAVERDILVQWVRKRNPWIVFRLFSRMLGKPRVRLK